MVNESVCLLFPGQGAQYPHMSMDFYEASKAVRDLFNLAEDVCKMPLYNIIANGTEADLASTDVSQVVIALASLSASVYFSEKLNNAGLSVSGTAGFSLGEYPAYAFSKVISYENMFSLVKERGKAMKTACDTLEKEGKKTGMAAVIGLSDTQVLEALEGIEGVWPANMNASGQLVISGTDEALGKAEIACKEKGAKRFVRLKVSGPFHSPLLKMADEMFKPLLEKTVFNNPEIDLFSAVSANRIISAKDAKEKMLVQMSSPVLWTSVEKELSISLQEAHFNYLCDVGPGRVLSGLWKTVGNTSPCFTVGTVAEANAITHSFLESAEDAFSKQQGIGA